MSDSPTTAGRGISFHGPMRLADLVYGVWALMPEHLRELQAIYEVHVRGEKIDVAAIEARLGRPLANKQQGYEVINGVAVLPAQGVISPKANLMTQISGGVSSQMLARDVQAAAADPSVKSILLAIDSPGGSVLGLHELTQTVREAAAAKPMAAFSDGTMASAAYHFGSAANSIQISGPMVLVGSIGCIAVHRDESGAEAKLGIKTTEITAGKYKNALSSNAPLSKAGREYLQEMVDSAYSLFVDDVAAHRGVSTDAVLEHMADGRVFMGPRSVDAGLVDGFSSLDALVESMATDPAKYARRSVARIKAISPPKSASAGAARADASLTNHERSPMSANEGAAVPAPIITAENLEREHPTVHAAIYAAGAAAERTRVAEVRAQSLPGHEALIEAFVADGKTTGAQAAMAVLKAERDMVTAAKAAHAADAPPAAKSSAAPADKPDLLAQQREAAATTVALFHKVNGVKHG